MGFINRHKTAVVLTAALVLVAGGSFVSGQFDCGSGCCLTSLFTSSVAQAGPGCASHTKAGSACTDTKAEKTNATAASAKSASGCCASKSASATKASASTCTDAKAKATQADAKASGCSASCAKTCSADNKEACIAKCMAEKGLTREEAEKCWASCQAREAKAQTAAAIQKADAKDAKACSKACTATCEKTCGGHGTAAIHSSDAKNTHSREACIDACVAKGMSRADAEAAADKCGKAGYHTASVQTTEAAATGSMK